MTNKVHFKLLNKLTGASFAHITDKKVVHATTGDVIPAEHLAYQDANKEDGLYSLTEATCGGSMICGLDHMGSVIYAEDTEENREKYQCRVGRPAPQCISYIKAKCGVYFLDKVKDSSILRIKTTDLINILEK